MIETETISNFRAADLLRDMLEEGAVFYSKEQKQALQGAIDYYEDERRYSGRDSRKTANAA